MTCAVPATTALQPRLDPALLTSTMPPQACINHSTSLPTTTGATAPVPLMRACQQHGQSDMSKTVWLACRACWGQEHLVLVPVRVSL